MDADVAVTAIILAGGQSTRMGQDKALIEIDGVPLLRRICRVALTCTQSVYVVTPWGDRYSAIVPAPCQLIAEVALPGEDAIAHGPLVGFSQGLAQIEGDWVLLLACDLPQLTAVALQSWITQLVAINQLARVKGQSVEAIALLPQGPKGWEPLCGFYHCRALPSLQRFINDGGRSFQQWLSGQIVQPLDNVDFEQLFNCNTPADLQAILSR